MKIHTGDNVKILLGKDKGKVGKVIQTFPEYSKVVVENLNMATKHLKGNKTQPGKKIEYPSPLHVSNVALVTLDGKTGRIGYDILEKDGKKIKNRVVRSGGKSETIA